MELQGFENIELELKYCERCGGLWLRVRGRNDVYCVACTAQLAQEADLHGRRRRKAKSAQTGNHLAGARRVTDISRREGSVQ